MIGLFCWNLRRQARLLKQKRKEVANVRVLINALRNDDSVYLRDQDAYHYITHYSAIADGRMGLPSLQEAIADLLEEFIRRNHE